MTNSEWAQVVASAGSAVAAIAAVFATIHSYRSAKHNNETNEQMIRPRVVVYVDNSSHDISYLDLVIHNEGGGLARDLTFEIIGDKPPVSFSNGKDKDLSQLEVISEGIKVLPAKSIRTYFMLSTIGQVKEILALKSRVKVSYTNSSRTKNYEDIFDLDFHSLPKMKFVDKGISNQKKISSEIEKIRKVMERKK